MTALSLFAVLLGLAACLSAVPAVVLLIEVFVAVAKGPLRLAWRGDDDVPGRGRIAVLIPAHDEALGISRTIASVSAQLSPGDRLLVVADNCKDLTASVARAAGASVVERHDPVRRGKAYALDFGVRQLHADPPDCVIIVDADCRLVPGSIDHLAFACARTRRPAQALNLCQVPDGVTRVGARFAQFAFVVKNQVRPRGLAWLGVPCALTGTGMAFPWDLLAETPLASDDLAEDMMLGSHLVARGLGPVFVESARVDSDFPSSVEGEQSQRRRWVHGHLQTLLQRVPRLILGAFVHGRPMQLAHALDLAVPPLAMLLMLQLMLAASAGVLAVVGGSVVPLAWATFAIASTMLAVLVAWWRFGRDLLSGAMLWMAPVYMLRKVPLLLGFLFARQVGWQRTRRDGE
ncbi:MAG: glycosyltransferase family 2 protein [Burkholderiaceae bacterium]